MNDITPPKRPAVATSPSPAQPQANVHTRVAPRKRRWPKVLGLLVLVAVVLAGIFAWRYWQNRNVYAIAGGYTISKQDFAAAKKSIASADKANGVAAVKLDEQARSLLILNAALKAEADKAGVDSSTTKIDEFAKKSYDESGGKLGYYTAMKAKYGWTDADTTLRLTNQYLQSQLQEKLLGHRVYSLSYIRWDNIRMYNGGQPDADKEAQAMTRLQSDFLPLYQQKLSRAEISQKADLHSGQTAEEVGAVMGKLAGLEVHAGVIDSRDLVKVNAFAKYKEGEDLAANLDSLKTAGEFTQPIMTNIGYTAIIRLESTNAAPYNSWDQLIEKYQGKATRPGFIFSRSLAARVGDGLSAAAEAIVPAAKAAGVDCLDVNLHRITYNLSFIDTKTGGGVQGSKIVATARRNVSECLPQRYNDRGQYGYNATTPNAQGWYTVTFTSGALGTRYAMALDCNGPEWSFNITPPADHTYVSANFPPWENVANGAEYDVRVLLKPKQGRIVSVKTVPNGQGGWVAGDAGGAGTKTCINNTLCSSDTLWTWDGGMPGVFNTEAASVATGWQYVGSDIVYSANCLGHTGTETTSATNFNIRVCTDVTVTRYYHYKPTAGSGSVQLIMGNQPTSGGGVTKTCVDNTSCNTGADWTRSGLGTGNHPTSTYTTATGWTPKLSTTIKYSANCGPHRASVTETGSANPVVQVCAGQKVTVTFGYNNSVLAPTYGPWLQSTHGDVMVLGSILGQVSGSLGSRKADNAARDSEYVVMGYVVNNFCSARDYDLGRQSAPGTCSYLAGYKANVDATVFGSITTDPVLKGLDKSLTLYTVTDQANCTTKKPYLIADSSNIQLSLANATEKCQVIMQATNNNFVINATTLSKGRGTLYVKGNVTITGNITYNNSSAKNFVNEVPNFGIVATGNITINSGVGKVDASLYAAGKVKTCDSYPSTTCNNRLVIRGKLAAGGGFELGRNNFDKDNPIASELVVSSGLVDAFPPPGFVDLTTSDARGIRFISTDNNPRF